MRHKFWFVILLMQAALLAFGGPKEDAAQKRKEAEKLSTQGEYLKALAAYEEASALFADPSDWLSRAQVLMKLKRFTEANDAYQQFLNSGKAGKKQKEIERAIEDLSIILQTKISCSSSPEGATVYLNSMVDAPLGVTPFEQNLPPGTHRLIFQKEGFDTLSQVVTVEARSSQTVQVTLPVQPAVVSISAAPVSADISINGEARGKTPLDLKLTDGVYTIEAAASGYPTQRKRFDVKGKQSYSWSIDLAAPPAGTVRLSLSPGNASAIINGETFSNDASISLPPGTYTASVSAPSYKTQQQELVVESEKELSLSVLLEAQGVLLQVKTNRPTFTLSVGGASIRLDDAGKAVLPGGSQTLSLSAPKASSWSQSVELSGAMLASVEFNKAPTLGTKLVLASSAGAAVTSGFFLYAGLIRARGIRENCIADPDFCQANIEAFEALDRERGVFLTTSLATLLAAGGLFSYYMHRRESEGATKVTLTGSVPE